MSLLKNKTRIIGFVCLVAISITTVFCVRHTTEKDLTLQEQPKDIPQSNEEDAPVIENLKDKAIIIIPGITASDLVADEEYSDGDVTVKTGDALWIPQKLKDGFEKLFSGDDFDLSLFSYDSLANINTSVEMLKMNESGESRYKIKAKEYTNEEHYGIFGMAYPLYYRLNKEYSKEYDVIFYSYDWRLSTRDTALALEKMINEKGYKEVSLVCHSMGGIVASQYISLSSDNADKVEKLITVGTPFGGSPRALMALQTGRFFDTSMTDSFVRDLSANMPSVYELLPTPSYIDSNGGYIFANEKALDSSESEKFISEEMKSFADDKAPGANKTVYEKALSSISALEKDGDHVINREDIDVYMIAGYNSSTVTSITQKDSVTELVSKSYAGDATVPLASAIMYNGEYFDNPIYLADGVSHSALMLDYDCIELICTLIEKGDLVSEKDYNTKKLSSPDKIVLKDDNELEDEVITPGFLDEILNFN